MGTKHAEAPGKLMVKWLSGAVVAELPREDGETAGALKLRLQGVEGVAEVWRLRLLAGDSVLADDEFLEPSGELTLLNLQQRPQPGHYYATYTRGDQYHHFHGRVSLFLSEDGSLQGSITEQEGILIGRGQFADVQHPFEGRGSWDCVDASMVLTWNSAETAGAELVGEASRAEWVPGGTCITWYLDKSFGLWTPMGEAAKRGDWGEVLEVLLRMQ